MATDGETAPDGGKDDQMDAIVAVSDNDIKRLASLL